MFFSVLKVCNGFNVVVTRVECRFTTLHVVASYSLGGQLVRHLL